MNEERITITVSKAILEALRNSVAQMHDFVESCQDDLERGNYHDYDYGMTDWREDIAGAAEELLDSIETPLEQP